MILARSRPYLVKSNEIRGDPSWFSTRFEEIQADFDKISTIFGEIRRDSRRSKLISTQMYWVFEDSGHSFEDLGDVCRMWQLPEQIEPTEHYPNPKPTQLIDAGGRFRAPQPSTRRRRVGFGLGRKPTRPDPWTALAQTWTKVWQGYKSKNICSRRPNLKEGCWKYEEPSLGKTRSHFGRALRGHLSGVHWDLLSWGLGRKPITSVMECK